MSLLGLDVGTSGCKAILAGPDGAILASATRSYRPAVPRLGGLELDPEIVWRAACAATREVVEQASEPPVAMSIAALGEAFVVLDGSGRPESPIIVSGDQRGTEPHRAFVERIGASRIVAITGLAPRPHYTASKISWWLEQGAMPNGWRFALVQDFIAGRLGLPPATDLSLAARTMLLDRASGAWSLELVDAVGIGVERLPQVVSAGTSIGHLDRLGKEAFGLRRDCDYIVGGLDAACAALGVGTIEPGQSALSLGTVASIASVLGPDVDAGAIPASPHVVPGRRMAIGAAQAAGAALAWYRDLISPPGSTQGPNTPVAFERLFDDIQDRPSNVVFVPHLAGSRFAFGDPNLSASLTGMTLATDRSELTRAVLEGVALELAIVCERFEAAGIAISALTASGGGTRANAWVQIIADVIGRPVASTGSGDAGALGAALLAGIGSGGFASFEAAAASGLEVHEVLQPRDANAAWWTRRRTDYKAIVAGLSEVASTDRLHIPRESINVSD